MECSAHSIGCCLETCRSLGVALSTLELSDWELARANCQLCCAHHNPASQCAIQATLNQHINPTDAAAVIARLAHLKFDCEFQGDQPIAISLVAWMHRARGDAALQPAVQVSKEARNKTLQPKFSKMSPTYLRLLSEKSTVFHRTHAAVIKQAALVCSS